MPRSTGQHHLLNAKGTEIIAQIPVYRRTEKLLVNSSFSSRGVDAETERDASVAFPVSGMAASNLVSSK